LNEEERFADMEGDLNEEERFADMEGDLNEEERFSDDGSESDYMQHSKIPKKEKFSDMLEEAPSGSCMSSDFASF
jgi:hypothetical protein